MEGSESILLTTKKILGISPDYTAFDLDIVVHINAAFSAIAQLGVGPDLLTGGYRISSAQDLWEDFVCPANQKDMVKDIIFLRVKLLFDPPQMGHHLTALNEQLTQMEWRLNVLREEALANG